MRRTNLLLAVALAAGIGVPVSGFAQGTNVTQPAPPAAGDPLIAAPSELGALEHASEWINSPPLKTSDLVGKVVLVDFWSYTNINSLRMLPYIRAWAEKYGDKGLVVIGVHAPEFDFEKDPDNVRRAVKELGIDYPVAMDNDHVIWRALANQHRPALYFFDAKGRVRGNHFGEGAYGQSERMIQDLLAEAGNGEITGLVSVAPKGFEESADWGDLRSMRTYIGYERGQGMSSPGGAMLDQPRMYEMPPSLGLNDWALAGAWTVKKDRAENDAGGTIAYRFHSRDLYLVMGPAVPGTSVRFRVRIDGKPPGAAHGSDVDESGNGTVTEQRLYQLVRQPQPIEDREFEIEFLGPGVEVFNFTFG